ncbi:MAG TPA: PilZ domain-containing protein [Gammaproteobacteria bacterium]|nr:PilZ domain-containing protein [Gammaproteobacteria bacterium]
MNAKAKNANQRVAPRVKPPKAAAVEVQIMGTDHIDVLPARDISISGIGVQVPHRFAGCDLGTEVELVITLPGMRSFRAYGIIRHWSGSSSDHFGVEFTRIDARHVSSISSYIKEYLEKLTKLPS